jgi:hypothetical protein
VPRKLREVKRVEHRGARSGGVEAGLSGRVVIGRRSLRAEHEEPRRKVIRSFLTSIKKKEEAENNKGKRGYAIRKRN